jgi:hypothetical protein
LRFAWGAAMGSGLPRKRDIYPEEYDASRRLIDQP